MSRALALLFSLLPLACGDVDVDDGNPFGSATEGTAGTGSEPTSGSATEATTSTPGTSSATEDTGTTPPDTATETTTDPPSTTGDSSGEPGESSGDPGNGTLSECVGTGAWESCDQVCASTNDVCVPSGCDGATVHYYNDVGNCTAMSTDSTSTQGCSEPFQMGGGISFARCCCQ